MLVRRTVPLLVNNACDECLGPIIPSFVRFDCPFELDVILLSSASESSRNACSSSSWSSSICSPSMSSRSSSNPSTSRFSSISSSRWSSLLNSSLDSAENDADGWRLLMFYAKTVVTPHYTNYAKARNPHSSFFQLSSLSGCFCIATASGVLVKIVPKAFINHIA